MNYLVRFSDIDNCDKREEWALLHCDTFTHRTITDVSDVSNTVDSIYEFYFSDEKDAMWFRLKWS